MDKNLSNVTPYVNPRHFSRSGFFVRLVRPTIKRQARPMPQHNARARIALGRFEAEAEIGPAGILAAGALVSAILLSVVPIVRVARAHAALPDAPQLPRLPAPDQP